MQDFALAEVPGGRALLALKRRPAGSGAPPLVLADASGDLPQAALEGREVAGKLGPTTRLLAGPAARSERLREGPSPAVLHLALHSGVGPTGPWLSLADRPVLASELIDWKVGAGADLVVLASCASAATRDTRGCGGRWPRRSWPRAADRWWRRCGRPPIPSAGRW